MLVIRQIRMDGMWVYNGWNMDGIWVEYQLYGWGMGGLWIEYGWHMGSISWIWVEWSGRNDQYRKKWKI